MHRPIAPPPPAFTAPRSSANAPRSVLDDDEPPALAAAWQRECQRLGCDRAGLAPDPHQRWTVPDLLMQPVQRLTRYGLLLQQLEDTLAAAAATLDPADMPHAVPVEVAMAAVARAKDTMRAVARAVDVQRREFERRAAARRFWTRVQVPPRPVLRGTLPTDLVIARAGGLAARGSGSSAGDGSVHTTTPQQQQQTATPPLRRRRSSVEVGLAKLRASFESAANEFRLLPDLDIGTSLRESLEPQMLPEVDGALDTAAAAPTPTTATAPTPTTATAPTPTTATAPAPSQPGRTADSSSLSAAGSSSGGPSVPPSPLERPTTWASPASTARSPPSEHATASPVPPCHAPPGESEGWSSLIATMRAKSELAVTALVYACGPPTAVVDLFARSLQTRTRWLAALYRVLRGALPTLWTDDYSTPRVSDDFAPLWLSQPSGWLPADADATVTRTFVQVPLEDPLTVCVSAPMTPPVSPTAPTAPHQARSTIAWSETGSPVSALSPAVTDSADWSQVAPVPPIPRRDRGDSVYWSRPGSADVPTGTHGFTTMVSTSSLATGSAVSSSVRAPAAAGIAELVSESSASSLHRNGTGSTNRTASSGGTTPSAGSFGTAPPASAPGLLIGLGGDDPDYVVEDTLACFSVRPISQVSASASTSTVTSKRRIWTAAHDLTRRATQAVQQKRKARKDKGGKHDESNGEETNVDTAFADLFTYIPTHRLTVLDMQAELEQPEPVGPAWTRQSMASEPVPRAAEPTPPPPPEPAHPPSEPPPSPTLSDLVLGVPICDEPSTARLAAPLPPLPPAAGGSPRLHASDSTATMRASLASEASSSSSTRPSKVVVAPATSAAPLRRVPERTTSISVHSTPRRSLVAADRVPPGASPSPPLPPRRGSGIGSPRMPSASSSPEVLARTPSLVVRRKRSSIVVVVPAITPATDPGGAPTAWPMRRPSVRASSPAQPRLSESAASVAAPSSSKTGGLLRGSQRARVGHNFLAK
ncbi:hypothetical protein AMAG_18113 [Allomyces macrogynus ATCC 38327]|uniref:DH domain-containing protein n=1 Tax=Allomyces macrogynus (strain ATCC 38327) TaxID=578462 RepID=A0A0L0S9M9_ALLM3|nr:hypothetical protein AMAG_18113 [Allomyces macrogynus ATCC 38327]|eukprot:KNE59157.1 hypothetical protein AMAG_18113 [Allomyces macrogynus ATCC 38327]